MFKQHMLMALCIFGPLQGMEITEQKSFHLSDKAKQLLFWSIASIPAYQGVTEGYEVLKEHIIDWQQTPATIAHPEVATYIHEEASNLTLPDYRIYIKEQSKPLTAGYATIMISQTYHDQLKQALENGTTADETALLKYHLHRASVYMNSYIKPKFIALSLALPVATGVACQFVDSYLPQDGMLSWVIMLLESFATSSLNAQLIQKFLNHMQDAADNAVPNDPEILKAGLAYLKQHSDPEKLSRRMHRIIAFQKRLNAAD